MIENRINVDKFLPEDLSTSEAERIADVLAKTDIAILRGNAADWADCFIASDFPKDAALICDNNTWQAMAEALSKALSEQGFRLTLLNLGSKPHADDTHLSYIKQHAQHCEALIVIGSGTLNDLAKIASFELDKPYAICGTAPSMNGYLSANAAIMAHGHKQSLPAHLPALALFDLEVLESAPKQLIAAGFGDSLCRSTAEIDWMLSHLLIGTAFDPLPFKLLKPLEAKLHEGDLTALIQTLLLSGLGMTLAGGSYPASQGEHLLAHYIEMQHPSISHAHLHGEHIAVTTLIMAEMQDRLLNSNSIPVLREAISNDDSVRLFGEAAEGVRKEYDAKQQTLAKANTQWESIKDTLSPLVIPAEKLRSILKLVGAPTSALEIGWSEQMIQDALCHAHLIRNRVTFLDLE